MTIEGRNTVGRLAGHNVFFPEVARDTDVSDTPTLDGVELFAVLRSRLSPEVLRYHVSLPAGASLAQSGTGATISRFGETLLHILPPRAKDAQGTEIPVSMSVTGSDILVSVPHRGLNIAYPLLVDPTVVISESPEGWYFEGSKIVESLSTPPPHLYIDAPTEYGRWFILVPKDLQPRHVNFYDVSTETTGTGQWSFEACNAGGPASGNYYNIEVQRSWGPGEEPCKVHNRIAAEVGNGWASVGSIAITYTPSGPEEEEIDFNQWSENSEGAPYNKQCFASDPVNCDTGNKVETQTDLSVGGRGPGLRVARTYNSQRAAIQGRESIPGPFGYGWTGPATAHLSFPEACWRNETGSFCEKTGVDVYEENGGGTYFEGAPGGPYTAAPLVQATLVDEGGTFIYTLPNHTKLAFSGSGQLLSRTDRNGNTIAVTHNAEGNVESIEDAAGRKLSFKYNSGKQVESITDPLGRTVKYGYENGNLVSVTEPGASSPRWRFKYNSEHAMTEMTDGRGNATTTEYASGRVVRQKDPLGRETKWSYTSGAEPETTITEPNGSTTFEKFNALGLPTSVTRAYGTTLAAKTTYQYNGAYELTAVTNADNNKTEYGYDSTGDRISEKDPEGNATKWRYDSAHDLETTTTPMGETTTITRDSHGNPEVIERSAPEGQTQKTTYKYDSNGDLISVTDPLERTTKYEYDSSGDRIAEIKPGGSKRTWGYNGDSEETLTVSPRGNVSGAEPSAFTTNIERDSEGRPLVVTEPELTTAGKPEDKTASSISGLTKDGQSLAASTGMWVGAPTLAYEYQWQRCDSSGASCTNVTGATGTTYTLGNSDVEHTIRVVVTASNSEGSAASTSEATAVVTSPLPLYGASFGSFGSGSGQLLEPSDLVTDASGNIWVADTENARLEEWNAKNEFVRTVGSYGPENGKFEGLYGVAVDSAGHIWTSECGNDRIDEFSSEGVFIKNFGSKGSANEQFNCPEGLAIAPSGNIYVADRGNHRVQELNSEGKWIKNYSQSVEHEGPFDVKLDPSGDLWVSYAWESKIAEYGTEGTILQLWGTKGTAAGDLEDAYRLKIGPEGNIWLAEWGNNRVQVFTPTGTLVAAFGEYGSGEGQFFHARGISFSGSSVYVLDSGEFWRNTGNGRIEQWNFEASVTITPVKYSASFGSFGSGSGQLLEPSDLATDGSGNIWVADTENARLEEWNAKNEFVRTVGSYGPENGKFEGLYGVAVDSAGHIWTSECGNDRIDEFSSEGVFIKNFGSKGSANEQFNCPEGLAIAPSGNIYVADRGNHRVQELNSEGKWIKNYSQSVEHEGPFDVKLDPSGDLWVSYAWESKIAEYGTEGTILQLWGTKGTAAGDLEDAYRLKIGPEGNIWLAEWGNNRVQVFTPTGTLVAAFGEYGSGEGQFFHARGISFSSSSVYVLDSGEFWRNTGNGRIEQWADNGTPTNTKLPTISGSLIVDQTLRASTGDWTGTPAPTYTYQWQHCDSAGESCSNVSGATGAAYVLKQDDSGYTFRVVVTATNTYGSTSKMLTSTETLRPRREIQYTYDANGNLTSMTGSAGHTTKYVYDADNEKTAVEEPSGSTTETAYDSAGQVISQIDGDKHTTKYMRNVLEQVTEVTDPLGNKTVKEYDSTGAITSIVDPEKRATHFTYDADGRPREIKYSDAKTPSSKYEYDRDGNRVAMTDGTGTTSYIYDQLDRLIEVDDGRGEVIKYGYDLADEPTKITYPSGKTVTKAYSDEARLEKVTDWLGDSTRFTYDVDGDLTATIFPEETKDEDRYVYNDADQMSEVKMNGEGGALASVAYSRENNGNVIGTTDKGLPGAENVESTYDASGRLIIYGASAYEYDAANNATTMGTGSYKYDNASQLEAGPTASYSYDELGERVGATPSSGAATTYSYDQAGRLIGVTRNKEGEIPGIEDSYAYNGEGLPMSQTAAGATSYFSWDTVADMPLVLEDGTHSYIYGPQDAPIEQISSGGEVEYLHHDQAGSTRLITGPTGASEGSYTYTPYGAIDSHAGFATTPLGYDGQYTINDTGLIYLRARVYDPATAQFMTVDPAVSLTGVPYGYAGDNPLDEADPSGRCGLECIGGIVLGGVALASGVGEIAGATVAIGETAVSLGAVSAVAGGAAAGLDAKGCVAGSGVSCVGAAVGTIASAGAFGVATGVVTGEVADGVTAISISSGTLGFLSDLAGGLVPSPALAEGCGNA